MSVLVSSQENFPQYMTVMLKIILFHALNRDEEQLF